MPEAIELAFNHIDSAIADSQGDPDCATALKHIMCLSAAPPCIWDHDFIFIPPMYNLLPVCTNSCLAYARLQDDGKCESLYQYGQENFPDLTTIIDGLHRFDCLNTSSYYHFDDLNSILDPQECTDLFSEEQRGQYSAL